MQQRILVFKKNKTKPATSTDTKDQLKHGHKKNPEVIFVESRSQAHISLCFRQPSLPARSRSIPQGPLGSDEQNLKTAGGVCTRFGRGFASQARPCSSEMCWDVVRVWQAATPGTGSVLPRDAVVGLVTGGHRTKMSPLPPWAR